MPLATARAYQCANLLSQELQQLMGPVTYQDMGLEVPPLRPMPEPTIKDGQASVPEDTCYTDGS